MVKIRENQSRVLNNTAETTVRHWMLRESLQPNTHSITLLYAIRQNLSSFWDTMKLMHFDKVNVIF